MRLERGIAEGWLLLIGAIVLLSLLAGLAVTATSYLKGVEDKGYRRGKAEVQLKLDHFISTTRDAGLRAEQARQAQEAADRLDKEKLDAQNHDLRRDLAATRERLRLARSRPGGSVVPEAPAGAESPDRITFDRAEFTRAMDRFIERTEDLIAEGAAAVIDLDTAKAWAREPTGGR